MDSLANMQYDYILIFFAYTKIGILEIKFAVIFSIKYIIKKIVKYIDEKSIFLLYKVLNIYNL